MKDRFFWKSRLARQVTPNIIIYLLRRCVGYQGSKGNHCFQWGRLILPTRQITQAFWRGNSVIRLKQIWMALSHSSCSPTSRMRVLNDFLLINLFCALQVIDLIFHTSHYNYFCSGNVVVPLISLEYCYTIHVQALKVSLSQTFSSVVQYLHF